MVGLLITVVAIALVDAFNLSTIVSCAYLLNTPNPLRRTTSYIAGVFATYYLIGAALLIGFGDRINSFVDRARSSTVRDTVMLGFAFALICIAVHHWIRCTRALSKPFKKTRSPRSNRLVTAFWFGVSVTLIDLTTAVPYIAALGSIARTRTHRVAELLILLLYNLIYLLPALALVLARIKWGPQSVRTIERTRIKLSKHFADRRWAWFPGLVGVALFSWRAVVRLTEL